MTDRLEVLQSQLTTDLPAPKVLRDGDRWTNWAHVHGECRPARHLYPQSAAEVADNIRAARQAKASVRVAGAGMSPNATTFTGGWMLHTDRLRRILSVDPTTRVVWAEAGATLREVAADLASRGLTIPVVPSITDLTIGGAIAMAVHSSGLATGTWSSYVVAVRVVDGKGDLHTVDADTPVPADVAALLPKRDVPYRLIDAFACNLGALGVVVEVAFQAEPLSTMHVVSQPLSVKDARRVVDQRVTMNDFYRLLWTPYTDQCYETIGKRMPPADDEGATSVAGTVRSVRTDGGAKQDEAERRAHRLSRATHLVSGPTTMGGDQRHWEEERQSAAFKAAKAIKGPWLRHDVTENALFMAVSMPQIQPSVNRMYQRTFLADREEAYGPPHEVLVMDCLLRQHTMEFAIEARRWRELFDAVVALIDKEKLKVHFPVEVRFANADAAWMSPAHGRQTCYVGIVMYKPRNRDPPELARYFKLFEAAARACGGRPHWAKTFTTTTASGAALYPCLPAFAKLARRMDPDGILLNDWLKTTLSVA